MRDREREAVKASGVYRVAVTGDSFTEALQVDDELTFTRLAEIRLNAAADARSVEVWNFGMSGAGPVQQYLRARDAAPRFAIDAVVMVVDAGQLFAAEMSDDAYKPAYVEDGNGALAVGYAFRGRLSQRVRDALPGHVFFALMDHSRIARAVYLYYAHGGVAQSVAVATRSPPAHAPDSARLRTRYERDVASWRALRAQQPGDRALRWFGDLAALSRSSNTAIGVLFYGIGDPRIDCPAAMASRQALWCEMRARANRHGVILWDGVAHAATALSAATPLPALRGFSRQRGAGHLNIRGHRVYAGVLTAIVGRLADGQAGGDLQAD
jgi:hypothetical protein